MPICNKSKEKFQEKIFKLNCKAYLLLISNSQETLKNCFKKLFKVVKYLKNLFVQINLRLNFN